MNTPQEDSAHWQAEAAQWRERYERLLADIQVELQRDAERTQLSSLLLAALATVYKEHSR